uniref:Uncharacterized protein n=1 Tax=Phytophthora ramorum TaxID=164328 RepID=H3H6R6_PHYRM
RRTQQGAPPRGRAPGGGEQEPSEVEEGDEQLVQSGGGAAAHDEDAVAVEAAASAHLDEELAGRDEERAHRYVVTVRPAMAVLRYDWRLRKASTSEREVACLVLWTAVTSRRVMECPSLTPAVDDEVSAASSAELAGKGDRKMVDAHSIARMRRIAKQKKRAAKRLRAVNAERRKHATMTDATDVDAVVTALDSERRARREQQRSEAREVLAHRRQQQEVVRLPADGQVAKVRLVQQRKVTNGETAAGNDVCSVLAEDGLPTATMDVEGERLPVKLDSGARYLVAGTEWMLRGERMRRPAPVDVVEGIGGFMLDVIGVWTFHMRNAYGQAVTVEACIIDGCTDEFLVGVDFLQHHKATMDFEKNEVRYDERQQQVVIPFRTDTSDGGARVAAVRLVSRAKLMRSAVTPVEVAVAAPDDEDGVFLPTMTCGSVMLAATVTTSRNGKAMVPMINVQGGKAKLPGKKALGFWITLEKDMQVLALNGELDRDNLDAWLKELGDTETPLDNEDEVRVGEEEPNARAMVVRLLRAYRDVSKDKGDCPPVTALD